MIIEHKNLNNVPDQTVIWRYLSLAKFLNLLTQQKLHLHRMDLFEDKKEGTLPLVDKILLHYSSTNPSYWEREPKRHFINCWTESPHELSLMWHAYAINGVAIKTTAAALKQALSIDTEHKCYLFKVKYVDYENGSSQDGGEALNVLKILSSKRLYYKQEQEVRLLYSDYDTPDANKPEGHDFPIDVKALIEKVVISPYAETCTENIVRDEMKRIGLDKEITKSIFYDITDS